MGVFNEGRLRSAGPTPGAALAASLLDALPDSVAANAAATVSFAAAMTWLIRKTSPRISR